MKRKELARLLRNMGYEVAKGKGSKHEKWTNGAYIVLVPRHREINEHTARAILNEAHAHREPDNVD